MGIEWVFISFIKYIFIEGYSPSEDMIEGITGPVFIQLKKMLKQKSKTVREKLKETYTPDQIRLIEVVLKTEGAEYLVKSSAYVYENNADEKSIAKDIFNSFKQKYNQRKFNSGTYTYEGLIEEVTLDYYDEDEVGHVIDGIALVLTSAVQTCLAMPAYNQVLTEKQKELQKEVDQHKGLIDILNDWFRQLEKRTEAFERYGSEPVQVNEKAVIQKLNMRLIQAKNSSPSFATINGRPDDDLYVRGIERIQIRNADRYVEYQDKNQIRTIPLKDFFELSWKKKEQNHILIEGEGGVGKTVSLLSFATESGFLPKSIPTIYIPLRNIELRESAMNAIEHYLADSFNFSNEERELIYRVIELPWDNGPRLLLLLDGFNEVPFRAQDELKFDILKWSKKPGIQIVTTSRFIPLFQGNFIRFILKPLTVEIVKTNLTRQGVLIPEDGTVMDILRTPLMLRIYIDVEHFKQDAEQNEMLFFRWRESKNAGTILWNYFQEELYKAINYSIIQGERSFSPAFCAYAIFIVSPYIAWKMVTKEQMAVSRQDLAKWIEETFKESNVEATGNPWLRMIRDIEIRYGRPLEMHLTEEQRDSMIIEILSKRVILVFERYVKVYGDDGNMTTGYYEYEFIHQNMRDALAALYIESLVTECVNEKQQIIPKEISSVEDLKVAQYIADLLTRSALAYIWELNRIKYPTDVALTHILIDLLLRSMHFYFSELNFSGMDLREIGIYIYHESNSRILNLSNSVANFKGTVASLNTFSAPGHNSEVIQTFISTSEGCMISCAKNGEIIIWDPVSAQIKHKEIYYAESISCLRYVDASNYYLVGYRDGCLGLLDIASCNMVWMSKRTETNIVNQLIDCSEKCYNVAITCIDVSINGLQCVCGSEDHCIRIYDMKTGLPLYVTKSYHECIGDRYDKFYYLWRYEKIEGHYSPILNVSFIQDTPNFFSLSVSEILIWKKRAVRYICEGIIRFPENIKQIYYNRKGTHCIIELVTGKFRIYNLESVDAIQVPDKLQNCQSVVSNSDSKKKYLVCGMKDGMIQIWDICHVNLVSQFIGARDLQNIYISSDGLFVIGELSDNLFCVWKNSGELLRSFVLKGINGIVTSKCMSTNLKKMVGGNETGNVYLWDFSTGELLYEIEGYDSVINSFQFSSDEAYCIFTVGNRTICWYDLKLGNISRRLDLPFESRMKLTVHSEGKMCTIRKKYEKLQICELNKESINQQCEISTKYETLNISNNGKVAVSLIEGQLLQFWETESGNEISRVELPTSIRGKISGRDIQISNDGKMCAFGLDAKIKPFVWKYEDIQKNAQENEKEYQICDIKSVNESYELRSCCVHFETMRCGSVSENGHILLWDLNKGDVLWKKKMHNNYSSIMSFSQDGLFFAYVELNIHQSYSSAKMSVCDAETGTELHQVFLNSPKYIRLSEHGKYCAVEDSLGLLTIWDLDSNRKILTHNNVLCVDIVGANLIGIKCDRKEVVDILKFNGAVIQ